MLMHFQFKPLFENKNIPGWNFSFYYKKQRNLQASITKPEKLNGRTNTPEQEDIDALTSQIHELMLFHVYE